MNLVKNPSFEQVSGASVTALYGYFGAVPPGGVGWAMKQTSATSAVPFWTATDVYPEPAYPPVLVMDNGTLVGQTTSRGTRFAAVPGQLGERSQEIVGTLATPTGVGVTYVLSADIAKIGFLYSPVVQLQLRNSTTGALSAPLVHEGIGGLAWGRVTGDVTANVSYDQVVLRYQEDPLEGWESWFYGNGVWLGLADDVRVCKAAAVAVLATGWWTTARIAGAIVAGVVLTGLGLGVRRRFRTRGRYGTATVRG